MVRLHEIVLIFFICCLGCAPVSESMREDMRLKNFEDAIERGRGWLDDANLEEQASAEGKRVHRLVAEARLAHATEKRSLVEFEGFRSDYAQFSSYDDLLQNCLELESEIYFVDRLTPKPSWDSFSQFRLNYRETKAYAKASRFIAQYEFERAKASNSLEDWQQFNERFLQWEDVPELLQEARQAESEAFIQRYLVDERSLERLRELAQRYPERIQETKWLDRLLNEEVIFAQKEDTVSSWEGLLERYPQPWAEPIRQAALNGKVDVRLSTARNENTDVAFQRLVDDYSSDPPRLERVYEAACARLADQLNSAVELRQPVDTVKVERLLSMSQHLPICREALKVRSEGFVPSALDGHLAMIRLVRLVGTPEVSQRLRSGVDEVSVAWDGLQKNPSQGLWREFLRTYPSIVEFSDVEGHYSTFKNNMPRQRLIIEHFGQGPIGWRKIGGLIGLVDAQGRATRPRRRVSFSMGPEGAPISASGLEDQSVTVWFSGAIGGDGTHNELIDEIREALRPFGVFAKSIKFGVITQGKRKPIWRRLSSVENVVKRLSESKPLDLRGVRKTLVRLNKEPFPSMLIYLGYDEIGNTKLDVVRCRATAEECAPQTEKQLRKIRELSNVPVIGFFPDDEDSASWRSVYQIFDWRTLPRSKMLQAMDAMAKAYVLRVPKRSRGDLNTVLFQQHTEHVWYREPLVLEEGKPQNQDRVAGEERDAQRNTHSSSGQGPQTVSEAPSNHTTSPAENRLVVSDANVAFRFEKNDDSKLPEVFVSWRKMPERSLGVVPMNLIGKSMDLDLSFDWYSRMICLHQHANYERWCRRLIHEKWRNVSVDPPQKSGKHRPVILPWRRAVWLILDEKGSLHRSVDGGREWQLQDTASPLSGLFAVQLHNHSMICAFGSDQKAGDADAYHLMCSKDDGRQWQVFLRSPTPMTHVDTREGLVIVSGQNRLVYSEILEEGRLPEALFFVGDSHRPTRTARWFLKNINAVKKDGEFLTMTRSLDPKDPENPTRSLALVPIGGSVSTTFNIENGKSKLPKWHYFRGKPVKPARADATNE